MTTYEFWGCGLMAFGLPFWMFVFTIAMDPLRVIVLITSAFFWLLSLLLSSVLWFAVVPLRDTLAFGLVFSVFIQEGFRYIFFLILRKADEGLQMVIQQESASGAGVQLVNNRHLMAYVTGLGVGLISGAFSLVNLLSDMSGPGTIGIQGDSQYFFIVSAILTLCFILLQTAWGIIFYDGLHTGKYLKTAAAITSHMCTSCVTLLNLKDLTYVSLPITLLMTVLMITWAYFTAGGSLKNLKDFFICKKSPELIQ